MGEVVPIEQGAFGEPDEPPHSFESVSRAAWVLITDRGQQAEVAEMDTHLEHYGDDRGYLASVVRDELRHERFAVALYAAERLRTLTEFTRQAKDIGPLVWAIAERAGNINHRTGQRHDDQTAELAVRYLDLLEGPGQV